MKEGYEERKGGYFLECEWPVSPVHGEKNKRVFGSGCEGVLCDLIAASRHVGVVSNPSAGTTWLQFERKGTTSGIRSFPHSSVSLIFLSLPEPRPT
jgi:hypothetical protein